MKSDKLLTAMEAAGSEFLEILTYYSGSAEPFSDRFYRANSAQGAAAVLHGAANAGAFGAAFAKDEGLVEMLPELYKLSGELLPAVIFARGRDFSAPMAVRTSGVSMVFAASPSEMADLAVASKAASLLTSTPFLVFADDFSGGRLERTSLWSGEESAELSSLFDLACLREKALNPNRPAMRGSHENGDVFFQNREASNKYYTAVPGVFNEILGKINKLRGTKYGAIEYYGDENAQNVVVAMDAVSETVKEAVDYLNAGGGSAGLVTVRLFRPLDWEGLAAAIPAGAKNVAVLDSAKEPGGQGGALYTDVTAALFAAGRQVSTLSALYGLGGKSTDVSDIFALFDRLYSPKGGKFVTLGITDDLTGYSLQKVTKPDRRETGQSLKLLGFSDGMTEKIARDIGEIIMENTENAVQIITKGEERKNGGIVVSNLRAGKKTGGAYYINTAQLVACADERILDAGVEIGKMASPGGKILINSSKSDEEILEKFSLPELEYMLKNGISLYAVNCAELAKKTGMGRKIDIVFFSSVFGLFEPFEGQKGLDLLKNRIVSENGEKGSDVLEMCVLAAETAFCEKRQIALRLPSKSQKQGSDDDRGISAKMACLGGNELPVSAFRDFADGTFLTDFARFFHRGAPEKIPVWDMDKCLQCNNCAFTCPHAALRPFMVSADEEKSAPEGVKLCRVKTGKGKGVYKYTMAVSPEICAGCGVCVGQCPTHAITLKSAEKEVNTQKIFDYLEEKCADKPELFDETVRFSQYKPPLLAADWACPGCAQTSYARIVTQLLGEKLAIINAPGCSKNWGGAAAASPYETKNGRGPAYLGALSQNAAETGLGFLVGSKKVREIKGSEPASVWLFGGDGWAFDGDFGGLDHVLASGERVKIMIFNNESSPSARVKNMAEMLMSYGYIYVAQVAMGADKGQTMKAILEAEAYPGPAVIIAYCPCRRHGIKGGMQGSQREMNRAVNSGYYNLFRFNPASEKGKLFIDSKEPTEDYGDFLMGEARFEKLSEDERKSMEAQAKQRYERLLKLKDIYDA